VGYANGHSRLVREPQGIATKVVDMAMNHIIGAMLAQDAFEVAGEFPRAFFVERTGDNLASKRTDFIVVGAGLLGMGQEVHSEAFAVNVTQNMHQPGFYAAAVHAADDVEDADRSCTHRYIPHL
jgi:hypothetical protein